MLNKRLKEGGEGKQQKSCDLLPPFHNNSHFGALQAKKSLNILWNLVEKYIKEAKIPFQLSIILKKVNI